MPKQEVKMIDCNQCKKTVKDNENRINCILRIKDKTPTTYSRVSRVLNCPYFKQK